MAYSAAAIHLRGYVIAQYWSNEEKMLSILWCEGNVHGVSIRMIQSTQL